MNNKFLSVIFISILTPVARADQHSVQIVYPALYKEECGSCHVAFPPGLLAGADWRRVMEQLGQHYGSAADLDAPARQQLLDWLERNTTIRAPAPHDKNGLPLLTQGGPFQRDHHEVPNQFWKDPRVKSPANCQACHGAAESGGYSEQDIILPELREEDD